jgi:hypothetical protein
MMRIPWLPSPDYNRRRRFLRTLALALLAGNGHAAVNEIFPADYVAPEPGSLTVTGYAFNRQLGGPYKDGKAAGDWDFSSSIGVLRLSAGAKLGDYTVSPVLVLSGAYNDAGGKLPGGHGELSSSGLGDPRFATTLWLLNQRQENQYLALTGMMIPPLGSYHRDEVFNIGENRWRGTLMLGWQRGWTPRWITELTGEAAWYGANDEYAGSHRLEQAPSLALTGYVRYKFTPALHGFAGAQLNAGGTTEIDGQDQHNSPRNQRLMLGVFYNAAPGLTLNLRYGRDVAHANGLRTEHEVALRAVKTF